MRNHAISLGFLVLLVLAGAAPGATAKAVRGVAYLSTSVGHDVSVADVRGFVEACGLDLVIVDFAWITGLYGGTDLVAVEELAEGLDEDGVRMAVMYRPRALRPRDADVHYARGADGRVAEGHLDLCFAHPDSVDWGASWGEKILAACPSVREMIIYNLGASCACEDCRGGKAVGHAERFLGTCRERWSRIRPGVSVGHVGLGVEYRNAVDRLYPFLSVNREKEDERRDVAAMVARLARLVPEAGGKPLTPLAKIYWGNATRNKTEDVVDAIEASDAAGLGIVLWYHGWLFRSADGRYDAAAVIRALGGDPAKITTTLEEAKPAVAAGVHGQEWVWFDSREAATGPKLRITRRNGREEVIPAGADSVLISYLADRAFGFHQRLSLSLGDTNRVLLAFPAERPSTIARAVVELTMHESNMPPPGPFEIAAHEVTKAWPEAETTWTNQPDFAEKPVAVVEVNPKAASVSIDVTAWARGKRRSHGLLLKATNPVPMKAMPPRPAPKRTGTKPTPAPETKDPWIQPPIRTGTPFSDTIPWAPTLEDALERAKAEDRPVFVTVVPVNYRHWVSGYRDAEKVWRSQSQPGFGRDRIHAIDSGLVKERAMMASLFTDPEIVHLVKAHFVPVRIRLHTYAFDAVGYSSTPDPLPRVGVTAREIGGPGLVFATPDGKLIHACRRMGVFSVPMVRAMLRAVLSKAGVKRIEPFPDDRPEKLRTAWIRARAGKLGDALEMLEDIAPPRGAPWRWEAGYLRAHLEDKLGKTDEARARWQAVADGDPAGPWGSKSAVRLMEREARLDEWESFHTFPFDPLTESTEVGRGDDTVEQVLERATDYLLLQQRPDGSWTECFYDVYPTSGPGSIWDKTVPRTGLVVDALMKMRRHLPERRKDLDAAITRGIDFVDRFATDPAPVAWQLTYALHLQAAILGSALPAARKRAARRHAKRLIVELAGIQQDGGWSYMPAPRTHSFNTAPVLLILEELRDLGVESPPAMAQAAAGFLETLRLEHDPHEFAYAPTMRHRTQGASSCRSAVCELALLEHSGKKDARGIRAGVELFFRYAAGVRASTKVFENYFSPAAMQDAYHDSFGHYYLARALARLPAAEAREHARRQLEMLLAQREVDGSFVDAQQQGKSYSTAMVLLTLDLDLGLALR